MTSSIFCDKYFNKLKIVVYSCLTTKKNIIIFLKKGVNEIKMRFILERDVEIRRDLFLQYEL